VPARACVAAIAVAAIVWLGTMERDLRLQASAVAAAERQDFARAEEDLRRARLLNPDTLPDIRRAFVLQGTARSREARALLEDVLRREPENLSAWRLLEAFTRDRDEVTRRRALAAIRRLDPVGSERR
jgi:predicted Zn-dependent protease